MTKRLEELNGRTQTRPVKNDHGEQKIQANGRR